MSNETFLVTGAFGCIGSWILRKLVDEEARLVAADLATDPARPRLLLSADELEQITFVQTDITDLSALKQVIEQYEITHIIHLAGLQVPFCKANPSLGAEVNVVGTVNVFEAARHFWGQVQGLAYASSLAVLGPADLYPQRPVPDDIQLYPGTLYGVYKQANEETARLYWQDWQIGSVGLRPYIVYGVARDQGMTSDSAKAILAAAAGRPFRIRFSGQVAVQYAADVAEMFIGAARAAYQGAAACNLRNDIVDVADFVDLLRTRVDDLQVTYPVESPLPFPADLDDSGLWRILGAMPHTPLDEAVDQTLDRFKELLAEDRVDLSQLEN
jgi:nucleoside-diphosphate-sugar epimerase